MDSQMASQDRYGYCPILYSLGIVGRKWQLPIICELSKKQFMRYGEIKRSLGGITNMMLTQSLKELEKRGMIKRIQYNEIPPRVEYSLSDRGKQILPSLRELAQFGINQMDESELEYSCTHQCCDMYHEYKIKANQSDIIKKRQSWDDEYKKVYKEILGGAEYRDKDTVEKMRTLFCHMLRVMTMEGEEFSRLTYAFFLKGDEPNSDVLDRQRPIYRMFRALGQEGQASGLIKKSLSLDTVVDAIIIFSDGMVTAWHMNRGSYDIVEDQREMIDWFFDSFRE